MRVIFEFIEINKLGSSPSGKTDIFEVRNLRNGAVLGQIRWHGAWRQYTFWPNGQTIFSNGCLLDICDFLDRLRR